MKPEEQPQPVELLAHIQAQAAAEILRVTAHARDEMREEAILLDEILEATATGGRVPESCG
jgi:hypothetical protein